MNQEELIYKWLNHELNAEELEAFKKLEDYNALAKLSNQTSLLKAPFYDTSAELESILKRLELKKRKKKNFFPMAMSIAAIFIVCIGIFYFFSAQDSTYNTLIGEKKSISLPDNSQVTLNALSELTFNASDWSDHREVHLNGEAYFKVAKGSKFDVKTSAGIVTVIGTQFNVKQRNDYFEVVCYEGLVNVNYDTYDVNLPPGNRFLIRDKKLIAADIENISAPSWTDNFSRFKSVPYREVLAEFERQYDFEIDLKSIDDSQLFTGSFTHDNVETALKSITLPLQLTYNKTNRTIILKRE